MSSPEEQKQLFQEELHRLESEMNIVLAQMDELEQQEPAPETSAPGEELVPTEGQSEANGAEEVDAFNQEEETTKFLGTNPTKLSDNLKLNEEVAARINAWLIKGLVKKDEKEKLLSSVPRKGSINLEAPALNEEILVDIFPKSLTRDNYFKDYQNMTGAALSNVSSVFDNILHDQEEPLERDEILEKLSCSIKLLSHLFFSLTSSRKAFLLGKYDEKVQKILKTIEPTTNLFGDNVKSVIDTSKAMEKVSKDLKPKVNQPVRKNNFLNWRSPSARREVNRGGARNFQRPNTSRTTQFSVRSRPYPARGHYHQTQPQQSRR